MVHHPFDELTEADLRRRQSAKWRVFPSDVLPMWVAEMDYPVAGPIRRALHDAIDVDDLGYADPRGLGTAFARFAARRWGWAVDPAHVTVACDVVTAMGELLEVLTEPGDRVVIDPPVYPPFAGTVRKHGRVVVETPLVDRRLDLVAIERAYAAGARVHLLCSPHNPSGTVPSRDELARIAALAARHDVIVLSDEIHAPLTYPGATHVPFPTASPEAAENAIVLASASKAWNLAGLKASVIVASSDKTRALVGRLPADLPYHAGHLGVLGARAAFEECEPWLDQTIAILDRNRMLLVDLLAEHLPAVEYTPPSAGYLAWLDCRALGLGDDPARAFLERGRVALSQGPTFGTQGKGFARLNLATTRSLLEEGVRRMATAVRKT